MVIYGYFYLQFDVRVTMHRVKFLIIKPTRCTTTQIYSWTETLPVSDSSSVHRQEFFNVHIAIVYVITKISQMGKSY
jgi:hypothetical protein